MTRSIVTHVQGKEKITVNEYYRQIAFFKVTFSTSLEQHQIKLNTKTLLVFIYLFVYCLLVYTCKLYSHCLMYVEDHICYMFMPSWGPNLEIKILYCIVKNLA